MKSPKTSRPTSDAQPRSLDAVVSCDEDKVGQLIENLYASVCNNYQKNKRRDGYCHACGMMTSQCNCWDTVVGSGAVVRRGRSKSK